MTLGIHQTTVSQHIRYALMILRRALQRERQEGMQRRCIWGYAKRRVDQLMRRRYFLSSFSFTQSPGARSYVQNLHPLQLLRLQATAPATDGEV